jgi:hypothetical protein
MLVSSVQTKYGNLCKHTKYSALNMQSIAFLNGENYKLQFQFLKKQIIVTCF